MKNEDWALNNESFREFFNSELEKNERTPALMGSWLSWFQIWQKSMWKVFLRIDPSINQHELIKQHAIPQCVPIPQKFMNRLSLLLHGVYLLQYQLPYPKSYFLFFSIFPWSRRWWDLCIAEREPRTVVIMCHHSYPASWHHVLLFLTYTWPGYNLLCVNCTSTM